MEGKKKTRGQLITVEERHFVDHQGSPTRKFKVTPPITTLKRGEKVAIVYDGPKSGVVMIPVPGVFNKQVHLVPRGKQPQIELKVLPKAPLGEFSFAVICNDGRSDHYGEGASPPKIVIKDPKP